MMPKLNRLNGENFGPNIKSYNFRVEGVKTTVGRVSGNQKIGLIVPQGMKLTYTLQTSRLYSVMRRKSFLTCSSSTFYFDSPGGSTIRESQPIV